MFKAAVIEDDPEIAELIGNRINKTEVVICSGTFKGPLSYIDSGQKDHILLLDILMPEMDGVDAIPKLLAYNPDLLIIMNTIKNNSEVIFNAIQAGAVGYLDKQSTSVDYRDVFTSILNGGAYLTPTIAFKIVNHFRNSKFEHNSLTDRENDVASKIKDGKTYAEIGNDLGISVNTVRMHIKNIYSKLQINSKYELINLGKSNLF